MYKVRQWLKRLCARRAANNSEPWHPLPQAPDVSELNGRARGTLASLAAAAIVGGGIGAMPAVGLLRNLVRLLIRAIEEYEAAVALQISAVTDGSATRFVLVSTHWEGCVEALHRCMLIAEIFRTQLGRWAPNDANLRIDRRARFTEQEQAPIRGIRHAVQHIDSELANYVRPTGSSDRGDGIFIACDGTEIRFHGHSVTYAQMVDYMSRLVELTHWLNMQELPAAHPLADPSCTTGVRFEGSEAYRRPFVLRDGVQEAAPADSASSGDSAV